MDNILFYLAVSTVLGMFLSYLIKPAMLIIFISILLILVLLYLHRKNKSRIIIIIVLFLFIGMADYKWFSLIESKLAEYEYKTIDIEVLILDNGIPKSGGIIYNAETKALLYEGKLYNYKEKILFKHYGNRAYSAGDIIKARGQAVGFISRRNFGDQDYSLYNKSRGIYNQFVSIDDELIKKSKNNLKIALFYRLRNRITEIINFSMPIREAAFLNAVIIGDKQWIDEEDMENFQKTGLVHLLSVSGLHVAFIALMLSKLFSIVKVKGKVNGLLSAIILIYYVMMIGAPPPAVRALIMMLVVTAGKNFNKEYDLLASVSFSALVMLILNPILIHNQGFIISYSCIYSIAFLYEPIYEKIKTIPIPNIIKKSISLSLTVQIGISPLLIYYFQYFSLSNIFLNIIAVPLTFVIIAIGFLGVIIGMFFLNISIYILAADYYLISFLLKLVDKISVIPFLGFSISVLPLYIYLIYYTILFILINKDSPIILYLWRQRLKIYMAAALLIMFICIKYVTNDDIRVVLLDVGQGDSILITTPKGKNILIDGGGSGALGSYYYNVGSKITVPALRKLGVWGLDTVILSHNHDDHLEGLIKVAKEYKINNVILPKVPFSNENLSSIIDILKNNGTKIYYAKENDKILLEKDISMEILSPLENIITGTSSDENNNSIVAKLRYKNFTALFAGDIEREAEILLADKDVSSIVLKVPHHGSSGSSSPEFIKKVSPKFSLIPVGHNVYGHPSSAAIENLKNVGSTIYRTDNNGAVRIISDGKKLRLKSVR